MDNEETKWRLSFLFHKEIPGQNEYLLKWKSQARKKVNWISEIRPKKLSQRLLLSYISGK